jgi:Protein of unknown function (DUF5672)
MKPSTVVVIPIYQHVLTPLEQRSLDHSLAWLEGREVCFIGPDHLDARYYAERYPGVPLIRFADPYFASIKGYNLLMLSPDFYQRFADHTFMLVLQTDAVLLRDELDFWAGQPYDYVGAPWPDGVEVLVQVDRFGGEHAKKVRAHVGNGGLSLRRIDKCIALLQEFPQAVDLFCRTGSSEDLFFALMGMLSHDFVLPNQIEASTFAMELKPSHYLQVNGGKEPMGGHAWWKYEPAFWASRLPAWPVDPVVEPGACVAPALS